MNEHIIVNMPETQEIETQTDNYSQDNIDCQTEIYDYQNSSEKNLNIIPFDPSLNIDIKNWMQYFDNICSENKLDDTWKLHNISKYLKGKAISIYINQCLSVKKFQEISLILQENFLNVSLPTFSEYTNLKLKNKTDINPYFHTKLEMGRKLGLSEKLILEGLTDGLPSDLKQLLILSPPNNATEWVTCVTKLLKAQEAENSSKPKQTHETISPRVPYRPNPRYNAPLNYRYNYSQNYRPQYRPSFGNIRPNFNNYPHQTNAPQRQILPNNNNSIHYQRELPPTPCRLCERQGIPNAYHWVQICPFSTYREPPRPNIRQSVENTQPKTTSSQ